MNNPIFIYIAAVHRIKCVFGVPYVSVFYNNPISTTYIFLNYYCVYVPVLFLVFLLCLVSMHVLTKRIIVSDDFLVLSPVFDCMVIERVL